MATTDPVTLALTGQLPFVLLLSVVLALPVSYALLQLYRRKVLAGMRGESAPSAEPSQAPIPLDSHPSIGAGELTLKVLDASAPDAGTAQPSYARAMSAPWHTGAIYATGGLAFAAIMACARLLSADEALSPLQLSLLLWIYAWPIVPTLHLTASAQAQTKYRLVAAYVAVLALVGGIAMAASTNFTLIDLATLWLSTNLGATLLLPLFFVRAVRAVSPLVVTFLFLAVAGSVLIFAVLERWEGVLWTLSNLGFALGLGATGVFWSLQLIGFALFAAPGWYALKGLRRLYETKRINDQSLALDALWLMAGISYSVFMVFDGPAWIVSGLAAFAAFKAVVLAGCRLAAPAVATGQEKRLLLLRVFSLGKRSERLFDAVAKHWRYLGSIQLIAGPDLVNATVEPHEFLAFLSRQLDKQFIAGANDLVARTASLDIAPDFDGRYRVNEFFCRDDTWRITLSHLAETADAILMDLRRFSKDSPGCIYELRALVNIAPLGRLVLCIDNSTDQAFLEKTLRQAWAGKRPDSPNLQPSAAITLLHLGKSGSDHLPALLAQLCMAAQP